MSRNILDEPQAKTGMLTDENGLDELFKEAVKVVTQYDRASASLIQRRLCIGYARAARIIDQLEASGVLSPSEGLSRARRVLINSIEDLKTKLEDDEKEEIAEEVTKYAPPKLDVVKKPKKIQWKYSLYDALHDKSFKNTQKFTFPVGFTEDKKLITGNLEDIKHLIIGGFTLSQKEVMVDTILTSLLFNSSPNDLRMILIDATRYLNFYNNIPHLLAPIINDVDKSLSAFRWLLFEADRRTKLFADAKVRDIDSFNKIKGHDLPHILMVINQAEDSFMFSPVEAEDSLARTLALAPRCGIHVFFTAAHLTANIFPSLIQSEISNRLLFKFVSYHEAGIKKVPELEKLETGEAIYVTEDKSIKINAIYTSDENVKDVVAAVQK